MVTLGFILLGLIPVSIILGLFTLIAAKKKGFGLLLIFLVPFILLFIAAQILSSI